MVFCGLCFGFMCCVAFLIISCTLRGHTTAIETCQKDLKYPLKQVWADLSCQPPGCSKGSCYVVVLSETSTICFLPGTNKWIIYKQISPRCTTCCVTSCNAPTCLLHILTETHSARDFSIKSCSSKGSLEPFQCWTGNPVSFFPHYN